VLFVPVKHSDSGGQNSLFLRRLSDKRNSNLK
jgi:hypothetical protein